MSVILGCFFFFFLMWTIFKVFGEFVTILLLLFFNLLVLFCFLTWRHLGSQLPNHRSNLSPCIGRGNSHHWMPGKPLIVFYFKSTSPVNINSQPSHSRPPSSLSCPLLKSLSVVEAQIGRPALANCCGQSTLFLDPSLEMTSGSPAAILAGHPSSVDPAYQNVVTSSFSLHKICESQQWKIVSRGQI